MDFQKEKALHLLALYADIFNLRHVLRFQDAFFDARKLAGAADSKGLAWMGGDAATSIRLGEVGAS